MEDLERNISLPSKPELNEIVRTLTKKLRLKVRKFKFDDARSDVTSQANHAE